VLGVLVGREGGEGEGMVSVAQTCGVLASSLIGFLLPGMYSIYGCGEGD
jgi:hypothetical protein